MMLSSRRNTVAAIPARMQERLNQLEMSVLAVRADGSADTLLSGEPVVDLIAGSALFRRQAERHFEALDAPPGQTVTLFPGCVLAPLPTGRRRQVRPAGNAAALVALLLTRDLLGSAALAEISREAGLAVDAVLGEIDEQSLLTEVGCRRASHALAWMHDDAIELERRMAEIQSMSGELAESYEELSLVYKLSMNMTVDQSPEAFLVEACDELQEVTTLSWLALQLTETDPRMEDLRGRLITAGQAGDTGRLRRVAAVLLDRYADASQPVIIDDTSAVGLPEVVEVASHMLVVPLRIDGRVLGLMFGGDKLDGSHISSVDSKLCDSLAHSLSIFLENMMLYEDVQAMFMGALRALTAAIDAKDSYTHGHSERVAILSRQLAEAAGLDAHTVERVYVSGLMHDVGKIGVPEAVLTKPGKLTDAEFDQIKLHPEIGARIIGDIRQMQDLIPGVLHHHERWDGRGYPYRLAGEAIPPFGRIIGLADAFDAMSSNRTYRAARPRPQVLDEIRKCAGSQFDPELAPVFVGMDFEPYAEMLDRHALDVRKSA